MADRARPLRSAIWPGVAAASVAAALVLGPLVAVALRAEGPAALSASDRAALWFTIWQAAASALVSVGLAVPVARAFSRRSFAGRRLLVTLLGAPFLLPVIVAVMGILAVFGRNGLANTVLEYLGAPAIEIYGPQGVILAHVFFNLPLAVRLILQGWADIPAERFRLAASLGFQPRDMFRYLEWPMLRAVVPGAFVVIFLVCLTSFAVALVLGGGPAATTLELAIYQAYRFDFDLGRAALLGALQLGVCSVVAVLALRFAVPTAFGTGSGGVCERWDEQGWMTRVFDFGLVLLVSVFLVLPLASVIARGLPSLASLPSNLWVSALRSLAMAVATTAATLAFGLAIALTAARLSPSRARLLETAGTISLAASPLVIGTGLFLILRSVSDPASLAIPVTVAVNALMALPFALRSLCPAARTTETDYGMLADSLAISGIARLRHLYLPRLRGSVGFAAGLTAALAMGDLGVIALYSDPGRATLPMAIYQLMGAYRMDAAAGAALLLLVLSFGIFALLDHWGRADADT